MKTVVLLLLLLLCVVAGTFVHSVLDADIEDETDYGLSSFLRLYFKFQRMQSKKMGSHNEKSVQTRYNSSFEFFHYSRLIRWTQQNKIDKKFRLDQ